MIDSVIQALLKRVPVHQEGVLNGYQRAKLRDEVFPAVFRAPGSTTRGRIYSGVTPAEIAILDGFEWEDYVRIEELVQGSDGRIHRCSVFVLPEARLDKLSTFAWNLDDFVRSDLQTYLDRWKHKYDR